MSIEKVDPITHHRSPRGYFNAEHSFTFKTDNKNKTLDIQRLGGTTLVVFLTASDYKDVLQESLDVEVFLDGLRTIFPDLEIKWQGSDKNATSGLDAQGNPKTELRVAIEAKVKAWDALCRCYDEFSEYGLAESSCGEYREADDAAMLKLKAAYGNPDA